MGLHMSWKKTKVQNIGIAGQVVELVGKFTYLRSDIKFFGYSSPDIDRRIELAVINHWSTGSCLAQQESKRLYDATCLQHLRHSSGALLLQNMDASQGGWPENRGVQHELPTTHLGSDMA